MKAANKSGSPRRNASQLHIDAAKKEDGIHTVVNIAGVDIRFAPCAGPRDQVGVAGGVDNHFG
jgi:hypothetical protein